VNTKSKNNKRFDNTFLITEESLAIMTDEQLKRLFINLRSNINKNRRNRRSSKDKELDFCYVQREMQLRRDARQARKK
jgi:hypothetical protein